MRLAIDLDNTTINVGGKDSWNGWWDRWNADPWKFLDCPTVEGAPEILEAIHGMGHDIVYVTARHEHPVTHQWLADNRIDFGPLFEATRSKWEVDADVYLDDSPTVVEGLWKRGFCVVKFARPYNAATPCRHKVDTWVEFYDLIAFDGLDLGRRRNIPHKWEQRRRRAANGDARARA